MNCSRRLLGKALAFVGVCLLVGTAGPSASAQLIEPYEIIGRGHVDVGVNFNPSPPPNGTWNLQVIALESGQGYPPGIYEPNRALLFAGTNTRATQPAGSQWAFIGAGAGQRIWLLPQTQQPNRLFLGFASEQTSPTSIREYTDPDPRINDLGNAPWITISLRAVRGPAGAHFSLWQTDQFGTPIVWMSTFEGGITAVDKTFMIAGGHAHFNWGFTRPGLYEIEFEGSAFLPDGTPISSGPRKYYFGIETIPEPSSLALVLVAGGGALLAAWRRHVRRTATPEQSRHDAAG